MEGVLCRGGRRELGYLYGRVGALLRVVYPATATKADGLVASTVWEWIDAASADGGVCDIDRRTLPSRVTAEKHRSLVYPGLSRRLNRKVDASSGPTSGDATPDPTYRT